MFDRDRAQQLLTFLFGAGAGPVLPRLESLLEHHRHQLRNRRAAPPWTQADVFLISYPDQVRSPGTTALQSLTAFGRNHLADLISGIHLLPFLPSSSDDGFAVTDFRQVDPGLGTWRVVDAPGRDFRLMVDLVLNHASAQSGWFAAFRRGQPPYDAFFRVPEPDGDWSRVVRPRATPLSPVPSPGKRSGTACLHLPETHAVVKALRLAAHAAAPWVRLITETNVPHTDGLTYFGDGDESDLVYSFALPPLIIHALTTGHARPLTEWAASLTSPPGGGALFYFLASHDGIGLNGASGWLSDAQTDRLIERAGQCGSVSFRSSPTRGLRADEVNANLLDMLAGRA